MGEAPRFKLPVDATVVYLGLGSNLGDRQANLRTAVERLRRVVEVEAVSRVYESAPAGYLDQPDFLNLALRARSDLPPEDLFLALKQIERELGRTESFRNAPRVIDIDILEYDDVRLATEQLTIPHPRLRERAFVLLPLAEVHTRFAEEARALAAALPAATPTGEL